MLSSLTMNTDASHPTPALDPLSQLMVLYFIPEVERRRARGELPAGFSLDRVQAIFFADGRSTVVRVNDEVRALLRITTRPGAFDEGAVGQLVTAADVLAVEELKLPDDEDPDCGHVTAVRIGTHWYLAFDARYNKGHARRHLAAASEFLEAARFAQSRRLWRACVHNLFGAAELAAKALLLSRPDPATLGAKSHTFVHSRYNIEAKHGNVQADHRRAFNTLFNWWQDARYPESDFNVDPKVIDELLEAVSRQIATYANGCEASAS